MTRIEVPPHDIVGIRAANPSPFTLSGTNTWIIGREPAWLIDPGPALPEHIQSVVGEVAARGGLAGVALTHDHHDHAEAVAALRQSFPQAQFAAARGDVDMEMTGGLTFGPLEVVPTPGHAPDHLSFVWSAGFREADRPRTQRVAFTGDAVLGEGSVFLWPDPGALTDYLEGLRALRRAAPAIILPGHGPPVFDAMSKLEEYEEHRLERERRLVAALDAGKRTVQELLDEAWDDAPRELRPAAALTLAAHLDKLGQEGRLPEGVETPHISPLR